MSFKKYLFFTLMMFNTHGKLDLDSKFTARILGVSDSKRTVLVNRGREHGLELEQHAKLSLPNGIVARAVAVRLAPSRSVWSIYRFYAKDSITEKTVYTFKISSAIKLTTDESKALGALADTVDKKIEAIPQSREVDIKQKKIMKSIISSEKVISQYDNIDYSKLHDSELSEEDKQKEEDIDWSGLNGKKDGEQFDDRLDYSNLR